MDTRYIFALTLAVLFSCRGKDEQSDAFGNFETEETIISSEVAGKLICFPLELGDQVHEGDLLAIVDTSQMSLQIRQLYAQQQLITTKRVSVQAQVDVLKEQINNLKITQGRIHRMFTDKAATQQQADDVDGQMRVLEKQLKSISTQFVSIDSELEEVNARLNLAKDNLGKCYIRTLTPGTVLEKYAEPGEVVSPAKAIVKLGDLSQLNLRVYVSGAQLPGIKLGQEVEVLIDQDQHSNQSLKGEVSWISSEAEFTPKIIQTREERVKLVYAVKVKVKNDGRLKIGMPGEVRFERKQLIASYLMINIQNISKSYKDVQALKGVSFDVNKGELFGLIGPDGSGKTTLMRILVTLLIHDKGMALMAGLDVVNDYKKIRQLVGYMPGRFSLYQDLTVEENLEFFATVFGTTVEKNYELIRDIYVQIEPFKNRPAGKLSGGMKQKLALSCALIHKPDILVLDEPTTGVDAVSRKEFWEMLKKLQKQGITILVSTPYMDEAGLCDRVALMQKGQILAIESPSRIIERYRHQLFAVRSDHMYRLIFDLRQWNKTNTVYAFGQFLHFTSKNDDVEAVELEHYLLSKNHNQLQLMEIVPGIEDVFMDLMSHE